MSFRPGCPSNQNTQVFPAPSSPGTTNSRTATLGNGVISGFEKEKEKKKELRSRHRRCFPRESGSPAGSRVSQPRRPGIPCLPTSVWGTPLILTGCFWDNGHLYRADQPSPAPGLSCLNWLDAQSSLASAPESGECPPRAAGGRRRQSRPRPMAPPLLSQAPATTATAATRTGTRAGPGATSAARPALPRSGLARTCAAQVPTRDPRA